MTHRLNRRDLQRIAYRIARLARNWIARSIHLNHRDRVGFGVVVIDGARQAQLAIDRKCIPLCGEDEMVEIGRRSHRRGRLL